MWVSTQISRKKHSFSTEEGFFGVFFSGMSHGNTAAVYRSRCSRRIFQRAQNLDPRPMTWQWRRKLCHKAAMSDWFAGNVGCPDPGSGQDDLGVTDCGYLWVVGCCWCLRCQGKEERATTMTTTAATSTTSEQVMLIETGPHSMYPICFVRLSWPQPTLSTSFNLLPFPWIA